MVTAVEAEARGATPAQIQPMRHGPSWTLRTSSVAVTLQQMEDIDTFPTSGESTTKAPKPPWLLADESPYISPDKPTLSSDYRTCPLPAVVDGPVHLTGEERMAKGLSLLEGTEMGVRPGCPTLLPPPPSPIPLGCTPPRRCLCFTVWCLPPCLPSLLGCSLPGTGLLTWPWGSLWG